jgi:hypothetical protein
MNMHFTDPGMVPAKPKVASRDATLTAKARLIAWTRVLDVVAEQREALDHRIWREDADDVFLEADCQTWSELTRALADYLAARRAA